MPHSDARTLIGRSLRAHRGSGCQHQQTSWSIRSAILVPMSRQVTTRAEARPSWLVLGAFAIQALASLAVWFVVNDMSRGTGVSYNKDFSEWVRLSVVCSVFIV